MRILLSIAGQSIAIVTAGMLGVFVIIAAIVTIPALLFFKTINFLKL